MLDVRSVVSVCLVVALMAPIARPAEAKAPPSLKDAKGKSATSAQKKVIQRILDLAAAGMAADPHAFCPDVDKKGKFKRSTKNGLKYPKLKKKTKDQKYKLAPRPKPSPIPPGVPPGPDNGPSTGNGGGQAEVPEDSTWQDLFKCLADVKIEIVDDDEVGGDDYEGPPVVGFVKKRKKTIKILKSALDKATNGAGGDKGETTDAEATEELLKLLGEIFKALVRIKQGSTDGGAGGAGEDPGAPGADAGAYFIYCWLIDWLEALRASGSPASLNPDQKKALKGLAKGLGLDPDKADTTDGLRELAQEILDHDGGKALKAMKQASRWKNLSVKPPDSDGEVKKMVLPLPGGNGILDPTAPPFQLELNGADGSLTVELPLAEVFWFAPWPSVPSPARLLIAGRDALGQDTLLTYDDFDDDGLPESLLEMLPLEGLAADAVATVALDGAAFAVLLLDRDAASVNALRDLDGDGYPEQLAPESFAAFPELATADGFHHLAEEPDGLRIVLVERRPEGTTGPFFQRFFDLRDMNLDGVADETLVGLPHEIWTDDPFPTPKILDHDLEASGETVEPSFQAGDTRVYLEGHAPGDVLELTNLETGAVLGAVVLEDAQSWGAVDLPAPLLGGELFRVCSATFGECATYPVPPEGGVGHRSLDPVWDANGDGTDDWIAVSDRPARLLVAHGDRAGGVEGREVYVLPTVVDVEAIARREEDDLTFTHVAAELDPADGRLLFERVNGAPGFGLAQPVGDLDGDGLTGDLFAMQPLDGGGAMIHYALAPDSETWRQPFLVGLPEILTYELVDHDEDGDLDVILSTPYEGELDHLVAWHNGEFVDAGPIVEEAELPFLSTLPILGEQERGAGR